MGRDTGLNYPSGGAHNRTVFGDSAWSSAIGTSVMHQAPILAAMWPKDFCRDFDDFIQYNDATGEMWTLTGGTIGISATEPHGVLSMATAASASAEANAQKLVIWNLHATKTLYAEFKWHGGHATNGGWIVGLMTADTTPLASPATEYGVYFRKDDGDANIDCVTLSNGTATATDSGLDAVASTFNTLGFVATTTSVAFYNGATLLATHTTNIPGATDDLQLTIAGIATAGGTAMTVLCDWADVIQARTS